VEVQDGFIVGVFNYCDRWCETCPFTSHCRVFAHSARMEASLDPSFRALTEAPPLPSEQPDPPPAWVRELMEEMNEVCANPASVEEATGPRPEVLPEHEAISLRAAAYALAAGAWLDASGDWTAAASDPRSVIAWHHTLIPAKIHRALTGAASDRESGEEWQDCDGSAKVALLGIDRSDAAWREAAERGWATWADASPVLADLAWLRARLEQAFPRARAFVRPGFDEPDAVARLLAADAGE
jgi:hypothetical protein